MYYGVQAAAAEFQDGWSSGLEIDAGVVLTTGLAQLWNGGDEADEMDEQSVPEFQNNYEPGDDFLRTYFGAEWVSDAVVLEFDVFCSHPQLEVRYQFGSEEYPEWVGRYNDAFLITVDGVVVSMLPDGSQAVAVQSVNSVHPANVHLYIDNDLEIKTRDPAPDAETLVEYDGMTVQLVAHVFITPGETHQVRIVIADVGISVDDAYDSALFINADSIRNISVTQ
jgi:hypothetical protein